MVGIVSSLKTIGRRGAAGAEAMLARTWPAPVMLRPAPPARSSADIARVIESEIIPRLMLAHAPRGGAAPPPSSAVGPRTLDAFTRMTLSNEAPALTAYVEALVAGGLSLEGAYFDLLAPTARRLGDEWNEDLISFTDVTVGLSRLHQVVHAMRIDFPTRAPDPDARSICLMTAPGEQHAFGLFLLEDQFRRGGWRTWLDTAATREDAAQTVALEWFDVFGLSATSDTPTEVVESTLAGVRGASRNRRLFILVGGRLFDENPGLADAIGADAHCATADHALSLADNAVKPAALA